MDLSRNLCGCCCSVFPRAALAPVQKEQEELVAMLVRAPAACTFLTCHTCRDQLSAFATFLKVARGNIAKLRQIQEEQQAEGRVEAREGVEGKVQEAPDTTWPVEVAGQLEVSVRASPSPPVTWSPEHTVTITAIEEGQAKEAAAREANRLRNVRYRERKRAREAELRGFISCMPVETIDVTPDLSITMEEEDEGQEVKEEEEYWGREEAVSPPPCHLTPILVPTTEGTFPITPAFASVPAFAAAPLQADTDPEERRRRRNREASRRYRERARGDPELLRRMREQQNRRQKKYYARLKEKKQEDSQDYHEYLEEEVGDSSKMESVEAREAGREEEESKEEDRLPNSV